ncbi:MAG: class I SAM-dependent methyltransferase [Chloroflexota bacterium]|nr:class I SAM-dependent methyltransferase [Chloroflexota bacterium]
MKLSIIENEHDNDKPKRDFAARIISAYSGILKLYAVVRFRIIHLRFLEEIEQYLPPDGEILDLGCGFGLFAMYMALCKPDARVIGLDINARRLQLARDAAATLGIRNVFFQQQDLRDWRPDQTIGAAYALDVFHHIPTDNGNRLLCDLFAHLAPGGRFLLKDIDTTPRAMLWFTYLLDALMSPRDTFQYRSAGAWQRQLIASGFAPIHLHYLWDILPYPHILLICDKPAREGADVQE